MTVWMKCIYRYLVFKEEIVFLSTLTVVSVDYSGYNWVLKGKSSISVGTTSKIQYIFIVSEQDLPNWERVCFQWLDFKKN